jgi:Mrp family chromosome partitioning ATPase
VSTVALQLASTAASYANQRVLLVDCNLARASAARRLRLPSPAGLSEAMANGRGPECFVQRCQIQNLSVLAAGQTNGHHPAIYNVNDLRRVIDGLKENYDLLVFDAPPSGEGGLGVALARLMDGVLVVVEAERVSREVVQRTIEDLQRAQVNVLGAVLNKRR